MNRGALGRLLPLLLLALLHVAHGGEYDFTIEVPAGKLHCFFQSIDFNKHKSLEIDYQVIDGGDLNINFLLLLGADVLKQDSMKTDGSHKIPITQTGEYQFCFDNSFSYQAPKVVFFELFLFNEHGQLDEMDLSKVRAAPDAEFLKKMQDLGISMESFNAAAQRIKSELNKIEYHQSLMRAHEARDRAILASNYNRVSFWSVLNTIVLLCVGAIQVWMIRSMFEANSKMGKMLR